VGLEARHHPTKSGESVARKICHTPAPRDFLSA
jgi:hypothetical protein